MAGAERAGATPPAPESAQPALRRWLARVPHLGTLLRRTLKDAKADRIVGVSAEVAFFALLAIPPLLLVLAGSAGFVGDLLGPNVRDSLKESLVDGLGGFLAPETMESFVRPAVDEMFERGRGGIVSIGAVLALWSSSRLIKVLIEAMNIAYGVEDWRRPLRRRLLAVGLTFGGIIALTIFLPFVVAGPELGAAIDRRFGLGGVLGPLWRIMYWPMAAALAIALLTTLYHAAPNWKTPWRRDVPGAVLAAVSWVAAAFGLRVYVEIGLSGGAFGPLAAPIVLLLWLYASAFGVLLGAELNAEVEKMWPTPEAGPAAGRSRWLARRLEQAAGGVKRVTGRKRPEERETGPEPEPEGRSGAG